MENINPSQIVKELRDSFLSGKTRSLLWRKAQLEALYTMMTEEENRICDALYKDLRKSKQEAIVSEVLIVKADIASLIKNLDHWIKPDKVGKNMVTMMDSLCVEKQPLGVVFCITPWNYPVQLTIMPLAGAIAGGNCTLVKLSEIATHTEELLSEIVPKYMDPECIKVVTGGPAVSAKFLEEKFDYIFYTGNSSVGRIVMEAASVHLTPVTLELGGKSPCYIAPDANLQMVARRLIWGKFMNAGQTCIAPDYVMCPPNIVDPLSKELVSSLNEFYGEDPKKSSDFGRIISERQFDRLNKMLQGSKATKVVGGDTDKSDLYIAPTIFKDVRADDATMLEEIFGPILPIMPVKNETEAIYFINKCERPLALYAFTNDKSIMERFQSQTYSGALLFNDTVVHASVDGLPFGGIGHSGMGAYHGKFSFDTFTHKRGIMYKSTSEAVNNMFRYPPYNETKLSWISWALGSSTKSSSCAIL